MCANFWPHTSLQLIPHYVPHYVLCNFFFFFYWNESYFIWQKENKRTLTTMYNLLNSHVPSLSLISFLWGQRNVSWHTNCYILLLLFIIKDTSDESDHHFHHSFFLWMTLGRIRLCNLHPERDYLRIRHISSFQLIQSAFSHIGFSIASIFFFYMNTSNHMAVI